jgi:hypothetical protein
VSAVTALRWYADPQEPGAPGVGDLVVVRGHGLGHRPYRVVGGSPTGWFRWDVRDPRCHLTYSVREVRRPTPDELAAWMLSAGPEGQP